MNIWITAKDRPIADIIVECGMMRPDDRQLLDALIDRQIAHHGSLADSLAALDIPSSIQDLLGGVDDAGVQASFANIRTVRDGDHTARIHSPHSPTGMRYRVLRPHAKGGLGEVFLAEDQELHRQVALKEIREDLAGDSVSRSRFLLEAEVTGRLEHPGIVPVYGLGADPNGRLFYAMRFIKGDNLREAILRYYRPEKPFADDGERRLAFRQLLRRFVDVCNAVAYAHSRGVLHRDIKPGNVMLGKFGETLLIDWGLAKVGSSSPSRSATDVTDESTFRPSSGSGFAETVAGVALGTPAFMSPEQADGRLSDMGPASDIYSLGATLYMLLTSRPPVADGEIAVMLDKVKRGDFPTARQVNHDTSTALDAICRKAMTLKPEERYAAASDLAADVDHWLADESVSAKPETVWGRLGRWYRRNTKVAGLLAALVVVLGAGAAGATYLWLIADKERKRAEAAYEQTSNAVDEFYVKVSKHPRLRELGDLREELLAGALLHHEKVAEELANKPKYRLKVAEAWIRVSQIQRSRGRKEDAAHAAREALKLYRALDDENKDDETLLGSVALALENLVLSTTDRTEKESARNEERRIRRALADQNPAHKSGLAFTLHNDAVVYLGAGDFEKARLAAEECVRIREITAAAGHDSNDGRRLLPEAVRLLAHILAKCGKQNHLETGHRACGLYEDAIRQKPSSQNFRDLAWAYEVLAANYIQDGNTELAAYYYKKAFDTELQRLAQYTRENASGIQRDVVMRAHDLAMYNTKLASASEMAAHFHAMLAPASPSTLILGYAARAHIAQERNCLERVLEVAEPLPGESKVDGLRLSYVQAKSLLRIGEICRALCQPEKALGMWRRAYAKLPNIEKYFTEKPQYRRDSIQIARHFAEELAAQHQPDEAMDVLRKAVELGYKDVKHLQVSKEFEPLRGRADFLEVVKEVEAKSPDPPAKTDAKPEDERMRRLRLAVAIVTGWPMLR